MEAKINNRLAAIRKHRGASAASLAEIAGVTRQAIHSIEAGTYVPNTEVTLRLARALEVTVEELFSLPDEANAVTRQIETEMLGEGRPEKGQGVRLCQVGGQWLSVPVNAMPCFLPEADGVIAKPGRAWRSARVDCFAAEEQGKRQILLAGCDPAIGLVKGAVDIIAASACSRLALHWLKEGKVHIAGTHLEDSETGEFNLPYVRRELAGEEFTVVTFARWQEGFATAPGNPKAIREIGDLARKDVRFVNREMGSGSRALLDKLLAGAGIPRANVGGYGFTTFGHLDAASSVFHSEADVCLVTSSAARAFGLDFVPLHAERYDFVLRKQTLELPGAQAFLDILQRASLRRKLESLAGYDTAQTGDVIS